MDQFLKLLDQKGPLTGKELVKETGDEIFSAWQKCNSDNRIINCPVSRRYLRLDRKIDGYARLSPSIMREFLNYTVVGLEKQRPVMVSMAERLKQELAAISVKKIELARETASRVTNQLSANYTIMQGVTFIIAGDVVFNMAHSELRPEFSTGELVRGSDLDLIIVADNLSEDILKEIDRLVYNEKYNLLINPTSKEELDYIIKNLATVQEQLRFNNFKNMVASKILYEGLYLGGSRELFNRVKKQLENYNIGAKIAGMEKKASEDRVEAEKALASAREGQLSEELMSLFYTTEEKEEIF